MLSRTQPTSSVVQPSEDADFVDFWGGRVGWLGLQTERIWGGGMELADTWASGRAWLGMLYSDIGLVGFGFLREMFSVECVRWGLSRECGHHRQDE